LLIPVPVPEICKYIETNEGATECLKQFLGSPEQTAEKPDGALAICNAKINTTADLLGEDGERNP